MKKNNIDLLISYKAIDYILERISNDDNLDSVDRSIISLLLTEYKSILEASNGTND